eukprot:m.159480 g.159480  ORF g.159480 m.159480 type:complete len:338 (+) comp11799_c0_seq1:2781-3794(+)
MRQSESKSDQPGFGCRFYCGRWVCVVCVEGLTRPHLSVRRQPAFVCRETCTRDPAAMVHAKVLEAKERGKIEWQMWANVLAVCGGSLLILGGIIGQFGFENRDVATFSIIWGGIVSFLEWPRSKRLRGWTMARPFQGIIVTILERLGKFWTNLFFRSCLYIAGGIPTFFCLPCVFGGVVMIVCGVVYLVAAFKGEVWKPLYSRGSRGPSKGTTIKAPTYAPPRRPDAVAEEEHPRAPLTKASPDLSVVKKPKSRAPMAPTTAAPSAPPPSRPTPKPRAPKRAPPQLAISPEAAEWAVAVDESSGQKYYYNERTQETTWDVPAVLNPTMTTMHSPTGI